MKLTRPATLPQGCVNQRNAHQPVVKLPLAWHVLPDSSTASFCTELSHVSRPSTPGFNSQVSSSTSVDGLPISSETTESACGVPSEIVHTSHNRQRGPFSSSAASSQINPRARSVGENHAANEDKRDDFFVASDQASEIGRYRQQYRQVCSEYQRRSVDPSPSARPFAPRFHQQDAQRHLRGNAMPTSPAPGGGYDVVPGAQDCCTWSQSQVDMAEAERVTPQDINRQPDTVQQRMQLLQDLQDSIKTACAQPRPNHDDETLRKSGRQKIVIQKHAMQASQTALNSFFIFGTWWWTKYYYLFLPLITATVALNVIMVCSVIIAKIKHTVAPERKVIPSVPEALVMVIPCYNETENELSKSLNSLCDQIGIDDHKRTIMIICDGKVRGPGMEKTTADYLLEDILVHREERKYIRTAYLAWDQQYMDIVIQRGHYRGMPYFCIIKQQNQGKRDGLIVVRSFLYNFNIRGQNPTVIFSSVFFAEMAAWLLEAGITRVDHLLGMDADTTFDEKCVWNLLQESRYAKTVGVCGYVAVDYSQGRWSVWRLYQSAEYTIAQCLRRLHQSTVTKKVSCLPGCCQLLRICEETCGQEVLIEKFGYCPSVTDGLLAHIRATASEDRNHVCHMLSARPNAETRQALGARAITDVPRTWSVFLSQRRRWTLGATSNDLLLAFAPGVQWFERILALVNVITWFLNPFILASVASFVYACFHVEPRIIMAFVSVMLFPVLYYLVIPFWPCKDVREALQFWAGCACYIFLGPFINISVLLYACWNMDSFGWGKTRKVVAEDTSSSEKLRSMDTVPTRPQDGANEQRAQASSDRVAAVMNMEKQLGDRG